MKKTKTKPSKPILFSEHFNIDKKLLEELGVFNPLLNCDTKLFVEPLLLKSSQSPIIKESFKVFIQFFEDLMFLIKRSKVSEESDIHWREAKRRVKFPEYKSTCIGYGSATTEGGGAGKELNEKILMNAKEIIQSGQENPRMFTILPFLEEGIGGDIISDMTQKIINNEICKYTQDVLGKIGLEGDCEYKTEDGEVYNLLFNPFSKCVLKLLPQDVLTNLPLADDFDNWIVGQTQKNFELRKQINKVIGEAWLEKNKSEKKEDILNALKSNKGLFFEVVKIISDEDFSHYNLKEDYQGLYRWFEDAKSKIIKNHPLNITPILENSQEALNKAVLEIISYFKNLIEDKEIWRLFWTKRNTKMHHVNEIYSQMLFYMSCQIWLEAQSSLIKLERHFVFEDKKACFAFSLGNKFKTILQIKHADNGGGLAKFYEAQTKFCKTKAIYGFYVVISFKDDDTRQYKQIKDEEIENCKIIKIDAAEKEECEQAEFDFKGDYIGFENMPSDENLYLAEKIKGGQNSYKKHHKLKEKVEELCKEEMKNGGYKSALKLCEVISYKIEQDFKNLLDDFEPYQTHCEDGGGWTRGSFYNWCNDSFKNFKPLEV